MSSRRSMILLGVVLGLVCLVVVTRPWSKGECDESPLAADLCQYEEILRTAPGDAVGARARILTIQDPVTRSAAVQAWIRQNPQVEPETALPFCALLDATEAEFCRRRVTAPHLRGR